MDWNIAQAKQQFSEVVRLCAEEPQAIYRREVPVAALVSAAEYEEFQRWRAQHSAASLTAQFDELRAALQAAGTDGLELPARQALERPNAFVQAAGPAD